MSGRIEVESLPQVDRDADRAIYRQIEDALRRAIAKAGSGDVLPSESELMAHFGVARMTVRQAMTELRHAGLVEPRHGKGVFVSASDH